MGKPTKNLTSLPSDSPEGGRDAWFANLRHSLRTPLNAIIGFSEMMLEDFEDKDQKEISEDLKKINIAGKQMLTMVNKILDPDKLNEAELDLNTIGANLHYELRIPLNAALGYSEMLLEDAEVNAQDDFLFDLRKIHVAVNRLLAMLNALKIPRFQNNKQGLSKEIATDSALIHKVRTTALAFEEEIKNLSQASLLVVDDNELNRNLLAKRLERQNYIVSLAEDGRQALEIVEKGRFDLILLDTVMPEMNGLEVLEQLKSNPKFKNIPVIMISAFDEIDSVVTCIELGAEDYLMKPFNPLVLRARVGTCLEKKRLRDKEIEYLCNVSKLTSAANEIEKGTFDVSVLKEVSQRDDELGSLARVFESMAREVHNREILLETKIKERTIKLDETIEELNKALGLAHISEQNAVESEKKAIAASQAKTIFLASMSHELRTPLTAILGFAQLMERNKTRDQDDKDYLTIISRSGEHLLGLINDVLSISKIEAGKVTVQEQPFNLPRLLKTLENMLQIRARSKSINLSFHTINKIPDYVLGDEGKLRQILINLLGNAIKFTNHGSVSLSLIWQQDTAYFEIKDTGYGISPEDQTKLFSNFSQTESGKKLGEGTGLGLAISKQFIELMLGKISFTSELGVGTTFRFDVKLPFSKKTSKETYDLKILALAPNQPNYRILVAEDKWEEQTLLIKLLSLVGFDLRQASNGKETLEIWRDWQPHLIFLDLNMPMVSGYLVTKIVRDLEVGKIIDNNEVKVDFSNLKIKNPHTYIVAISASVMDYERNNILAVGCDDIVAKPYKENTIFNKLNDHLGVTYIYEELEPSEKVFSQEASSSSILALIPQELSSKLYKTIALGDISESFEVLDEMAPYDENSVNHLRSLIKNYRFDELLKILKK